MACPIMTSVPVATLYRLTASERMPARPCPAQSGGAFTWSVEQCEQCAFQFARAAIAKNHRLDG